MFKQFAERSKKVQQIKSYLQSVVEKCNVRATRKRNLNIKLLNHGFYHWQYWRFSRRKFMRFRDREGKDPVRPVASTYRTYRRYALMYTEHDVPISFDRATQLVILVSTYQTVNIRSRAVVRVFVIIHQILTYHIS